MMRGAEAATPQRLAGATFWSLVGLSAILLAAFLAAFAAWGLMPAAFYGRCVRFLRVMPVVERAALAALFLFGIGSLSAGVGHLLQQLLATRRLVGALRQRGLGTVPAPVEGMARTLRLGGRVEVALDRDVYAFSFGVWPPRVMLSTGMLDLLTPEELHALLLHEAYHVRTLDALKVAIARAMARALFFVPLAQDLAHGYLIHKELAADEHVMREMGDRWPLASALYKLARRAQDCTVAGAVAGGSGDAALRIQHLLAYPGAVTIPVIGSRARALASAMTVALLIGLSAAVLGTAGASARPVTCPMVMNGAAPSFLSRGREG